MGREGKRREGKGREGGREGEGNNAEHIHHTHANHITRSGGSFVLEKFLLFKHSTPSVTSVSSPRLLNEIYSYQRVYCPYSQTTFRTQPIVVVWDVVIEETAPKNYYFLFFS